MDIRFHGKRALVTGAGKGIGRCIAKALSEGGAHTIAISRTQSDLDSLKQEDPRIETVLLDVSDWDKTRKVVSALGPVDCLVNNAGVLKMTPATEATPEEFDWLFNINTKAVMNISQIVAKGMIERQSGGSIVHITSAGSTIAAQGLMAYQGSKAAVDQMANVMALEWGPHQIRVNCVRPVLVLTPMGQSIATLAPDIGVEVAKRIPQRKLPTVEDVMRPVLFLLSDQSDMVSGSTLLVDGGFTGTA